VVGTGLLKDVEALEMVSHLDARAWTRSSFLLLVVTTTGMTMLARRMMSGIVIWLLLATSAIVLARRMTVVDPCSTGVLQLWGAGSVFVCELDSVGIRRRQVSLRASVMQEASGAL